MLSHYALLLNLTRVREQVQFSVHLFTTETWQLVAYDLIRSSQRAQRYKCHESARWCNCMPVRKWLRVPVPLTSVTSHPTCCHFIEVQINVTASFPVSAAILTDYRWLHLLYHAISINTKSDIPQMRLNRFIPKPTEQIYCLLSTKATSYISGLNLNSWRATALHSFAPTLIKYT